MKFVAVSTVLDQGAANVSKEVLDDAGIPVELRRVGGSAYFGGSDTIEVRVPEDRVMDAQQALQRLQGELEDALLSEASKHMPENGVAALAGRRRLSQKAVLLLLLPLIVVLTAVAVGVFLQATREKPSATQP